MSGLYSTYRWQKARRRFLRTHPVCVLCEQIGITSLADTVDHIVPHKGNEALIWDEANWQPTCKACHDSRKALLERGDKMLPHPSWQAEGGGSINGELNLSTPFASNRKQ
jgi:5-methylcytosine-specific restriction endonuclease McrA